MVVLRLFAGAREAAGTGRDDLPGRTVAEVLDAARHRYGAAFSEVVQHCQIWCNGEPASGTEAVADSDEVAVLPARLGRGQLMARSGTTAPGRRPKPVRSSDEGKPTSRVPTRQQRLRRRYAVVHDTNGPPRPAGDGVVRARRSGDRDRTPPDGHRVWRCGRRRGGPDGALLAAAPQPAERAGCRGHGRAHGRRGLPGRGGAGIGILAGVVLAVVVAAGDANARTSNVADAGWTIQCALPPGLVALSMVLLARLDQGSAFALLLLVSAYEIGDFLVGSGSRNPYEGPAAGASAVVVITFIISTLPISTLGFAEAWLFGGMTVLLAPLGQLAASALLPTAKSPASGLRRLDSLLLTAPVWCFGIGLLVAG